MKKEWCVLGLALRHLPCYSSLWQNSASASSRMRHPRFSWSCESFHNAPIGMSLFNLNNIIPVNGRTSSFLYGFIGLLGQKLSQCLKIANTPILLDLHVYEYIIFLQMDWECPVRGRSSTPYRFFFISDRFWSHNPSHFLSWATANFRFQNLVWPIHAVRM